MINADRSGIWVAITAFAPREAGAAMEIPSETPAMVSDVVMGSLLRQQANRLDDVQKRLVVGLLLDPHLPGTPSERFLLNSVEKVLRRNHTEGSAVFVVNAPRRGKRGELFTYRSFKGPMNSPMTELLMYKLSLALDEAKGNKSLEAIVLNTFQKEQKDQGKSDGDIFLLTMAARVLCSCRRRAALFPSLMGDPWCTTGLNLTFGGTKPAWRKHHDNR